VVDIRRDGDRLFAQCTGMARTSNKIPLPRITSELLPVSSTQFFDRMFGIPVTFSADARGQVTRLRAPLFGTWLTFARTADRAPDPPKPLVPVRLNAKVCNACVGQYEFGPDDLFPDGVQLKIWRQGDGLAGQAADKHGGYGAFEVYPLSETNLYFNLAIVGVQLNLAKNAQGEVASVIRHVYWLPDRAGKKLSSSGH
jgi:hypothetical protein